MDKGKNVKRTRLRIIDHLLSSGKKINFKDAAVALNEELKLCNSEKAYLYVYGDYFRRDIDTIREIIKNQGIRDDMLKTEGSNRNRKYWYIEPGFSIMDFLQYHFTKAEYEMLEEALDTLVLPSTIYNKVEFSLRSRIEYDFGRGEKYVDYGENLYLRGRRWLPLIYEHLNKSVLEISYKPYYDNPYLFKLCPYLLKQYNNRWYLVGRIDEIKNSFWEKPPKDIDKINPNYWIVPVDRIKDIRICNDEKLITRPENYVDFFNQFIGTHQQEYRSKTMLPGTSQKIVLKVSNSNAFYSIETKPLHVSQQVLERYNGSYGKIQIDVIPNIEFYNKLMELGENVIVESPSCIREIVIERLNNILNKYKNG